MTPQPGPESAPQAPVNPASMSVAELARALGVPEATIRRHLAEGAPRQAHAGGDRLNLVHYAAWLNMDPTDNDA
ncbi:MAG: hypothetical protein ACIAXF_06140 [Phycisphaerales bacterium JB063]